MKILLVSFVLFSLALFPWATGCGQRVTDSVAPVSSPSPTLTPAPSPEPTPPIVAAVTPAPSPSPTPSPEPIIQPSPTFSPTRPPSPTTLPSPTPTPLKLEQKYLHPVHGWSISYPTDWTLNSANDRNVLISHTSGIVSIQWTNTISGKRLEDRVNELLRDLEGQRLRSGMTTVTLSRGTTTLADGRSALDFLFELKTEGRANQKERVVVADQYSDMFTIFARTSSTLWDRLNPLFDLMIKSFTVRK